MTGPTAGARAPQPAIGAPGPRVVVIGSLNIDLTADVAQLPQPGETVIAATVRRESGGKGGNQAAACARLTPGAVRMVAKVGDDDAGRLLRDDLQAAGVDVTHVEVLPSTPSGAAWICVDASGENTVVVAPGANAGWHLDDARTIDIGPEDVVVCQLEIPLAIVEVVIQRAAAVGAQVVLNAAPAQRVSDQVLASVSVLVVNQTEAAQILGGTPTDPDTLAELARDLPCDVVVTLGADGALVRTAGGPVTHIPAFSVSVVSTVGAGDAFVGALAAGLLQRRPLLDAARRASAAGALATRAAGARAGLATEAEIDSLMRKSTGSRMETSPND